MVSAVTLYRQIKVFSHTLAAVRERIGQEVLSKIDMSQRTLVMDYFSVKLRISHVAFKLLVVVFLFLGLVMVFLLAGCIK